MYQVYGNINPLDPINEGLVSHFGLNDGGSIVYDHVGIPGILTNGPIFTGGRGDLSVYFDGSDDRIEIPNTERWGITPNNRNISCSLWVNIPSTSLKGAFLKVGNNGPVGDGVGVGIGIGNTTMDAVGNNIILLAEHAAWYNTGVAAGTGWVHIGFVIQNNINKYVYKNGALVFVNNNSGSGMYSVNGKSYIGGYTSSTSDNRHFNGTISDVRIYNRGLSSAEMSMLASGYDVGKYRRIYYTMSYGIGAWKGNLLNAGASGTLTATSVDDVIEAGMALSFKKA